MKKFLIIPTILLFVTAIILFILSTTFFPVKHLSVIEKYSNAYSLNPILISSIINVESNYNSKSVSDAGAVGLMQILPSTAEEIATKLNIDNYDLFDVDTNIQFGCYYMSYLLNLYNNDESKALMAYNAGLGTVNHWISQNINSNDIPYKETKDYLKKIEFNKIIYTKKISKEAVF